MTPIMLITSKKGEKQVMNKRSLWICVASVLLWIVFIFCRSFQPAATSALESRWVLTLLRRLVPFELTEHFIRKLAHFTEFAILGVLAGILFGGRCRHLWTGFLFAGMTGVITALCDETIQLFVPGRMGQIRDVWIDVAGASIGAVITLIVGAVRHRKNL